MILVVLVVVVIVMVVMVMVVDSTCGRDSCGGGGHNEDGVDSGSGWA